MNIILFTGSNMETIIVTLGLFCLAGVSSWYFFATMSKLIDKDSDNDLG